ncbi:hypothetical protein CPU12_04365 [Malaciobacter molluscorum LMG 25693]|uniref:Uncharacterized protein n=1 Tax=Malaciobacter molluscorum LMG 25693 TaxID=870501 RepID=A0A2G1DJ34_9BACT|nr:hypothetical protein [Malaciobacter molluscorum]AXX91685.1 hypothetical protein AMOL_0687 [Malaciobacter molluscorum LMG 25693]PHO18519.1 hypothetical protein CPU12_04365 [Malaciobacter molluscorum LMG 25693]
MNLYDLLNKIFDMYPMGFPIVFTIICFLVIAGIVGILYFFNGLIAEKVINRYLKKYFENKKKEYGEIVMNFEREKEFKQKEVLVLNDEKSIISKTLHTLDYKYTTNEENWKGKMVILYLLDVEANDKNQEKRHEVFKEKLKILKTLDKNEHILLIYATQPNFEIGKYKDNLPKKYTFVNSQFTLIERLYSAYIISNIKE